MGCWLHGATVSGPRAEGTYTGRARTAGICAERPQIRRNLHRGGPDQREPTQRVQNRSYKEKGPEHKESTQRGTRARGIYTKRHQNMKNLYREAPEHKTITQRTTKT